MMPSSLTKKLEEQEHFPVSCSNIVQHEWLQNVQAEEGTEKRFTAAQN
jgi:hypothetical protein